MNNKKKILLLIVEDEIILIKLLEEKLLAAGFEVSIALDGDEGLKLALSQHPDLILLDLLMPKMDGLTMLNNLRKDAWGVNANVVVLTNLSNPSKAVEVASQMKMKPEGVDEYIVKTNTSLDNLVARIKEKLGVK